MTVGDTSNTPQQQSWPSDPVSVPVDEALRGGWVEIWYQPKIDLKRKCLAGAEALTRIRHPQHGMLTLDSILPGIEELDLVRISEHALIAALRDWSDFAGAGVNLHLAVDVPAKLLDKLPIAEIVARHRPRADNWPGLILDVSEDEIARDMALAKKAAAALKEYGIAIAIDDFGAGYSSFSSLRELPFAELKLDGSFVTNCATDATNAAICQTAIDLAHRFGSLAVAEGIERMTDLQALMVMGCDIGQGPLVAPPLPKQPFLDLLRHRLSGARPQAETATAGRVA
jgi:EAL domain-containing protein (putative c-di-GMP-specific phosphodiesterase class I)